MRLFKSLETCLVSGLFLFLLSNVFVCRFAEAKKITPDITQFWSNSLNYISSQGTPELEEIWFEKFLSHKIESTLLLRQYLEVVASTQDRSRLITGVQKVSEAFECKAQSKQNTMCIFLRKLWLGNLDSVLFFEDSPAKVEKIRVALQNGECNGMVAGFSDLFQREGAAKQVLELGIALFECVKDTEQANTYRMNLKKTELF